MAYQLLCHYWLRVSGPNSKNFKIEDSILRSTIGFGFPCSGSPVLLISIRKLDSYTLLNLLGRWIANLLQLCSLHRPYFSKVSQILSIFSWQLMMNSTSTSCTSLTDSVLIQLTKQSNVFWVAVQMGSGLIGCVLSNH